MCNGNEMQSICCRIKLKRQSMKLSYQKLADATGISKSTLQRYETGSIKNIPLNKLKILATALDTTPQYILGISSSCDIPRKQYNIFVENIKYLKNKQNLSNKKIATNSSLPVKIINDILMQKNILNDEKILFLVANGFGFSLPTLLNNKLYEKDDNPDIDLINKIKQINKEGKKKLVNYVDDLIASKKYNL